MADDLVQRLRVSAGIAPHWLRNVYREAADEIERLRAEVERLQHDNRILEIKNRGTLANNLCPDHRDKQQGKPCLACTIEALELKTEKAERERDVLRAEVTEAKRRASNAEFELAGLEQMRLRDNQYLIERAETAERELAALREMVRED